MNKRSLNQILCVFLQNIKKYAQTTVYNPKYNRFIRVNIADINLAIADLNAAKTQVKPNESAAIGCINKIILYLQWYRTVGIGGDISAVGKNNNIPSVEEYKSLIRTGLFGDNFIMSLASILKLNDSIPQFKNEFSNLQA